VHACVKGNWTDFCDWTALMLPWASGKSGHLPTIVDSTDDFAWPWAWYLRKHDNLTMRELGQGYEPPVGSVVLASWQNNASLSLRFEFGCAMALAISLAMS